MLSLIYSNFLIFFFLLCSPLPLPTHSKQGDRTGSAGVTSIKEEGANMLILNYAKLFHSLLEHMPTPVRVAQKKLIPVNSFQDLLSVTEGIMGFPRK